MAICIHSNSTLTFFFSFFSLNVAMLHTLSHGMSDHQQAASPSNSVVVPVPVPHVGVPRPLHTHRHIPSSSEDAVLPPAGISANTQSTLITYWRQLQQKNLTTLPHCSNGSSNTLLHLPDRSLSFSHQTHCVCLHIYPPELCSHHLGKGLHVLIFLPSLGSQFAANPSFHVFHYYCLLFLLLLLFILFCVAVCMDSTTSHNYP